MDEFRHIPNNDLFDPNENMLAVKVDRGIFHRVFLTADYASDLVKEGTPNALSRAEAVIRAVLDCQELDRNNPHYGNFFWEKEEGIVEDLNAVEFVLIRFIPMIFHYSDRLSVAIQQRLKQAIRIALDEISRIDVSLIYTNIVAQDIVNSILGGQLLADPQYINRGVEKLVKWQALIDGNGIPHEYNSPVYTSVTINALSHLIDLADDEEAKMIAKFIMIRLGISFALHIHPKTKRLAGPHCRAYYPHLTFHTAPESDVLAHHIAQGQLPHWLRKLISHRPPIMNIRETSDLHNQTSIGTYHGRSFSLGVATRELDSQSNRYISNQSNVFSVQFTCGDDKNLGIVYSRYLLNDRWLGDYRTTLSRGNRDVFFDEGSFRGVQDGARSINIYAPLSLGAWERCFSAKACIIWESNIDEIWVDGTDIYELPVDIINANVIVVGCGDIYLAIRPLSLTDLGQHAPIRLTKREEHLVLELYNYLGPTKTFWELAYPGAFYQGRSHCGFYAEVAEKSDYASGADFASIVAEGKLIEHVDEPITFNGHNQRLWSVEYERDNAKLGIELDMMLFDIKQFWTHHASNSLPMLDSPIAIEASNGEIVIGDSRLTCDADDGARWLISLPEAKLWIAAYHGPKPSSFILDTPEGRIEIESLTRGMVVWDNGEVDLDTSNVVGLPRLIGGKLRAK